MRGFSRVGTTYGLVVCGSCIIGFCLGPSDDLRMLMIVIGMVMICETPFHKLL